MSETVPLTPEKTPEPAYHFLYFADPMCSWCYGFSPVIRELTEEFKDRLGCRVVMGGLRAGNTTAMREQDRDYIRDAWKRVGEASGQPFDFAFFDRATFIYDTETRLPGSGCNPAPLSIAHARHVGGDQRGFLCAGA